MAKGWLMLDADGSASTATVLHAGGESQSKAELVGLHDPSPSFTKVCGQTTKGLRGALAFDDAAQAAVRQIPAYPFRSRVLPRGSMPVTEPDKAEHCCSMAYHLVVLGPLSTLFSLNLCILFS
jgi:hypothetical protein